MNADNKLFLTPEVRNLEELHLIQPAAHAAALGDLGCLETLLQQEGWTPKALHSLLKSIEGSGHDIAGVKRISVSNPQVTALLINALINDPDAARAQVTQKMKDESAVREQSVALIEARVEALAAKDIEQRSDPGLTAREDDVGLSL